MPDERLSDTVFIGNDLGLHARAASKLVKVARRFDASVEVECGERVADGHSIVSLLTLAASKGRTLKITTDGPEAAAALTALVALVGGGFGEDLTEE